MTVANWNNQNIMFNAEAVSMEIGEAVSNQMPQAHILGQIVESTQRRCVEIMLEFVEECKDPSEEQLYPEWTCDFPSTVLVAWAARPFRQEWDVKQMCNMLRRQYTRRMNQVKRNRVKV